MTQHRHTQPARLGASPRQSLPYRPRAQRGLGLATALFVITVMALLAVLITQLVRSNARSIEEELNLVRAFFAAQSGVEYGLNRAFPPDGSASQCPAVTNTTADFTPPAITAPGLTQCTMDVECATLVVDTKKYYTLTSTGTCGQVSRTVQVRAQ